jgi:hypothetical protein
LTAKADHAPQRNLEVEIHFTFEVPISDDSKIDKFIPSLKRKTMMADWNIGINMPGTVAHLCD